MEGASDVVPHISLPTYSWKKIGGQRWEECSSSFSINISLLLGRRKKECCLVLKLV